MLRVCHPRTREESVVLLVGDPVSGGCPDSVRPKETVRLFGRGRVSRHPCPSCGDPVVVDALLEHSSGLAGDPTHARRRTTISEWIASVSRLVVGRP